MWTLELCSIIHAICTCSRKWGACWYSGKMLSVPPSAKGCSPGPWSSTHWLKLYKSCFFFRFNFWGFRWMKTMIHTIKEINKRKDILPNITLGYQIFDTCLTTSKSAEEALGFLTGREENKTNFRNSTGAFLAGIVGVCGSSLSSAVSRILGLYYLPQVILS